MLTDGRCRDGGRPEAAGYVLSALDPDDALSFGEHLLICEICRAAAASGRAVQRPPPGQLAITDPYPRPPGSWSPRMVKRSVGQAQGPPFPRWRGHRSRPLRTKYLHFPPLR